MIRVAYSQLGRTIIELRCTEYGEGETRPAHDVVRRVFTYKSEAEATRAAKKNGWPLDNTWRDA